MDLFEKIKNREEKISVIGLGYVGMPLAISFARVADVIGFDIDRLKVEEYLKGRDVTKEVGDQAIQETKAQLTWEEERLKEARFHIVAVPTPINKDKTPNLEPVKSASRTVGRNLVKGSIVVFESTVFPGVTEEICLPILEEESGLKCGLDFKLGYSPERINPGDKIHRLENIVKVVAGSDQVALDTIAQVYGLVVEAGIHKAETIKVAEAAKVIENSQRDINIAFMNELSIIFDKLDIDTKAVLEAAGTKWNFLNFTPGLVGGHCIGVDPYYLTYKAEEIGYHSQIILAGRKINDEMGKHVAENTVKALINENKLIKGAKVLIMGVTFKENCPDVRNTKVVDIIDELKEYGVDSKLVDPVADQEDLAKTYGLELLDYEEVEDVDAIIVAVGHEEFKSLELDDLKLKYNFKNGYKNEKTCKKVLMDLKGIYSKKEAQDKGFLYWRL